ncbi:MAG: NAD+ synthase [Deltaproteobacteria bacterium]|uniref:NH(3)-dependent NAD(+) synthetase n=1 Tax=Candidatus Zymogenus saltonus TaxID=2844893 RepID=A0A9D8KEA8_9DELT|nr:NAD+ synthase [Candidatus Zymogenus saltonus]
MMSEKGFKKVVLGMSGGVDSTLGAFLAAEALGPENVTGILMPYKSSSPASLEHAGLSADKLGIETMIIDITPMVDAYFVRFPDADHVRRGNKMARERMSILYDQAQRGGSLVLGTSNKTETMLGYSTIHGDSASAFNPLGAIYKTEVWMMANLMGVPKVIVEKAPTADLWEGQTDEGELGIDYLTADRILYHLIELKSAENEIEALGIPKAKISAIKNLIEKSEFKRKMPDVPVLQR